VAVEGYPDPILDAELIGLKIAADRRARNAGALLDGTVTRRRKDVRAVSGGGGETERTAVSGEAIGIVGSGITRSGVVDDDPRRNDAIGYSVRRIRSGGRIEDLFGGTEGTACRLED
jgi:hypothetical protein